MLLLQMVRDMGVIGFYVSDQPPKKPTGLKILPRECRDKLHGPVQNFRRVGRVGNLLGILLLECLVFLLEVFRKHRYGG